MDEGLEAGESAARWCADEDHDTDTEDHRPHGQVRADGRGGKSDHGTVDCQSDEGRYWETATVNEVTARSRCAMLPCAKPCPQKGGERDLSPCAEDENERHSSRGGVRSVWGQLNMYACIGN